MTVLIKVTLLLGFLLFVGEILSATSSIILLDLCTTQKWFIISNLILANQLILDLKPQFNTQCFSSLISKPLALNDSSKIWHS